MEKTSAPELNQFNNQITGSLLVAIILLVVIGLILSLSGLFLGPILFSIGILMGFAGYINIPAKPRTAGVITVWGTYVKIGNKPVVVGGKTIIANYFPFYIGVEQIVITNQDKDYDMTVISKEGTPLKGKMSITLLPDIEDAVDYIQAGEMKNIFEQLKEIIYRETQKLSNEYSSKEIITRGDLLCEKLYSSVKDKLEEGSFGVKIIKIQAHFEFPAKVIDAMEQSAAEDQERLVEFKEFKTDTDAAKNLQEEFRKAGENISLSECLERIKSLRLIRDQRYIKIDTDAKGNVILTDTRIDFGKDQNKKKGDK